MLEGKRIAVVVPAYNESAQIARALTSIPDFVDLVVVVDDASADETARRAREARPDAVVVRHAENRGVGAAIATGYAEALFRGADVVAVMAGDGQMDPEDLRAVALPAVRGEADYVKGDRFAYPGFWRTMPPHRALGSFTLAALTRRAAGLPRLSDSQCGYTAITAEALRKIDLASLWPRYGYPNDLLGALALAGLRIAEVPVRPVYRDETSGLRPYHLAPIGFVIARVYARRLLGAERRQG